VGYRGEELVNSYPIRLPPPYHGVVHSTGNIRELPSTHKEEGHDRLSPRNLHQGKSSTKNLARSEDLQTKGTCRRSLEELWAGKGKSIELFEAWREIADTRLQEPRSRGGKKPSVTLPGDKTYFFARYSNRVEGRRSGALGAQKEKGKTEVQQLGNGREWVRPSSRSDERKKKNRALASKALGRGRDQARSHHKEHRYLVSKKRIPLAAGGKIWGVVPELEDEGFWVSFGFGIKKTGDSFSDRK